MKSAPVLVTHGVAAVLGWFFTFLVLHGVITGTQASSLTQEVLPYAVSLAVAGLGLLAHRVTKPVASVEAKVDKVVEKEAPELSPALASFEQAIAAGLAALGASNG